MGKHDREAATGTKKRHAALEEEGVALGAADEAAELEAGAGDVAGKRRIGEDGVDPLRPRRRGPERVGADARLGALAGRHRQELGHANRPGVDVAAPRRHLTARARPGVGEKRAGAARRIDDVLAAPERERADGEIDHVPRCEKLPFFPFADARDELLEHGVEHLAHAAARGLRERAAEEIPHRFERRVGDVQGGGQLHPAPCLSRLRDARPDCTRAMGGPAVRRAGRSLCEEARRRERENELEGVDAARREDDLLDARDGAPRALADAVAFGQRATRRP